MMGVRGSYLVEKGRRVEARSASSGSFDCVWRMKPRQTPLRMTGYLQAR